MADYTTDEALAVLSDLGYTDTESKRLLVHLATVILDSSITYTDQFNMGQAVEMANRYFAIQRNAGGDLSSLSEKWYSGWFTDRTDYATVMEVANRIGPRFTRADHAGFRDSYWASIEDIVDRLWPS